MVKYPGLKGFLRSFRYALKGIGTVAKGERNFRIHLGVTVVVIVTGYFCHLSTIEWAIILVIIGLVLAMEVMNSAIEKLVDLASPGFDAKAGAVKNIAAGGVLISAIAAVIIGLIIFGPKILQELKVFFS